MASKKVLVPFGGWDCPARIPEGESGSWRVAHLLKSGGQYPFYGLLGTDFLAMPPHKITALQERRNGGWHDWMTDDPIYWHMMAVYAAMSKGRILVLGLGLGLVLRHLMQNPRAREVVVVERQPEVIEMVWGKFSLDERFRLEWGDFFDLVGSLGEFDAVIADLWVGKAYEPSFCELFLRTYEAVSETWPNAVSFYHGVDPWAKTLGWLRKAGTYDTIPRERKVEVLCEMAWQWSSP